MILATVNNKGGVGKTTTSVNLSAELARRGHRVLLIDLDSQGSASLSLGVARSELKPSAADVLLEKEFTEGVSIDQAIRQTSIENLDLLTGSMELANADLVLSDIENRVYRLGFAFWIIVQEYEFILVDCPPSLSLLSINALVAADAFIVPLVPQYLALEGLVNLLEAVDRINEGIGKKAKLLGFLLTMVDYRTSVAREIVSMIREHYKDQVFKTEIPINIRLAEAPSFGQTIFDYAKRSSGALAYRRLADELLERCHQALNK